MPDADVSQFLTSQSSAPISRALRPSERRAAVEAAREKNSDARLALSGDKLELDKARFMQAERKENREAADSAGHLSLEQSGLLLRQASAVLDAAKTHWEIQQQLRSKLAAIGALGELGSTTLRFDPKKHKTEQDALDEYNQHISDVLTKYHDAAGEPAIQKLLERKFADADRFRTAVESRDPVTYSPGPVGDAYRKQLPVLGPAGAASYAKAVQARLTRVDDALKTGLVSPSEVDAHKLQTGELDLDGLEKTVAMRQGAQVQSEHHARSIEDALTKLNSVATTLGVARDALGGTIDLSKVPMKDESLNAAMEGIKAASEALTSHIKGVASGAPDAASTPAAAAPPEQIRRSVADWIGRTATSAPAPNTKPVASTPPPVTSAPATSASPASQ